MMVEEGSFDGFEHHQQHPLKRSNSAGAAIPISGFHMSPGSPCGSDVSDSSLPALSSYVYRPLARTGAILPPPQPPIETEAVLVASSSTGKDPPTSLTLSLAVGEATAAPPGHKRSQTMPSLPPPHFPFQQFPPPPPATRNEFRSTFIQNHIQEEHRKREVEQAEQQKEREIEEQQQQSPEKSSMSFSSEFLTVMQEMIKKEVRNYMTGLEQNGMRDGIRNAAVKRIGT